MKKFIKKKKNENKKNLAILLDYIKKLEEEINKKEDKIKKQEN